jgi:hypothetical protein
MAPVSVQRVNPAGTAYPAPSSNGRVDRLSRPPGDQRMLDDALRKLRLDRRLMERRGWIPKAELERALAELPDVEDKAAPPETPGEPATPS